MAYVMRAEVLSLQMQNRKGQEGAVLCVLCRLSKRIPCHRHPEWIPLVRHTSQFPLGSGCVAVTM